jgi:hypothetical protein
MFGSFMNNRNINLIIYNISSVRYTEQKKILYQLYGSGCSFFLRILCTEEESTRYCVFFGFFAGVKKLYIKYIKLT